MRKWFISALVSISFAAILSGAVINVSEFGGLNTDDNPLFLKSQTPDAEDVTTDNGAGLEPRSGYIIFSTEPSKNLYAFYTSNGSKYLVTQSSNTLKATLGNSVFSVVISTVDPNVTTYISGLGDKLYFTNTTDGLKYWDTSSVTIIGTRAKFITTHKGRIWMGGVSGDERTIYVSEYLVGSNFTIPTDPVDTDPTRIQVQGALDDILTGFYSSFDDKLMWYKQRSFGGILGTRRSNFQSREYSNTVGTAYPDSISNCDGLLRWLGNDRIVYEFDGEKYYPINRDIDNYMDELEQGDLNLRQWVQTSAADWNAGTLGVGIDTATSSGDIGLFSGGTTTVSVFLATGTIRSGGSSDSLYVNASTAMRGAFALRYIATDNLALDKVTMSFSYKSLVAEGFESWVTLHQGATAPAAVVLDTSTNKVSENTNATGNLTTITTNYFFSQSTSTNKTLVVGNTYWFIMHTTVTALNQVSSTTIFSFNGSTNPLTAPSTRYFTIPIGVSSITVQLYGASGSTNSAISGGTLYGARGGFVHATMSVIPGEVYAVLVGGMGGKVYDNFYYADNTSPYGWNSGNSIPNNQTSVRCGGGASDFRRYPYSLSDRLFVAGGGGGMGDAASGSGFVTIGGIGGYPSGDSGQGDPTNYAGGGGGNQNSGGSSGTGASRSGSAGGFGYGGTYSTGIAGAWGGGGYYGGGAGGAFYSVSGTGGGGGGSSYSSSTGAVFQNGVWDGNGTSSITYILHAEFYSHEIEVPNLSSTTMLYTSSFTVSGSDYRSGSYDGDFQVYLGTMVFNSTFTTQTFDADTKFNEWGAIGLDDTVSGGSIVYSIFTDTDSSIDIYSSSTYLAKQIVTNGQTPTLEVGRYITVSGAFYRGNLSTHSAILHGITVNFSEGSSIRTFSQYINGRYWLSVAVSSTANNKVLVYDNNKQWHRYNIPISAICNYSGTFYFGNNNGIFQIDYGTTDNGTNINSYYRTKTYAPSGFDTYSVFGELYVTTENSASTLNSAFYVDEYNSSISMANYIMNEKLGYQNFKLPFSVSSIKQGKYISFLWTVNSGVYWRILNANLYYNSDPEPKE